MWSCLAALLLVLSYQEVQSALTCSDTANGRLTKMGNCTYFERMNLVKCVKFRKPEYKAYPNETYFAVLEQVHNNTKLITFCLGLGELFKFDFTDHSQCELNQLVTFDSTLAVGTMVVDRQCWEKDKSNVCLRDVSLLNEVLKLGMFQFTPDLEGFWNFQSPLFRPQLGWFQMLFIYSTMSDISSITWKLLESLQNTSLQTLTLTNNNWEREEPFLFKNMANLQNLDLSKNNIREFDNDSFIGINKLETLDLNNNLLTGIPAGIGRLPTLKALDVSGNTRRRNFTLSIKDLSKLQLLEILNLSNNKLLSITGKLPHLPNLIKLFLDECQLTDLEEDAFRNYPALECLSLSNNYLTKLEDKTFRSLHRLQILDLSNNNLVDWPILYACSLLNLNLSLNYLSSIKNLGYTGTTVEYLNISNNNISDWKDANVFSYYNSPSDTNLVQLLPAQSNSRTKKNDSYKLFRYSHYKLSSNSHLNHQNYPSFGTSENFLSQKYGSQTWKPPKKHLHFSSRSFTNIIPKNPQNFPFFKLYQLYRSRKYPILQNLRQTDKNLDNSPSRNTSGSSPLTSRTTRWVHTINISNNFIICVSEVMGRSLDGIRAIDLGGNPFDCSDCETPQFQKWLKRTTTKVNNFDTSDPLICVSPFAEQYKPVLEINFHDYRCLDKRQSLWITLGIPLGSILTALFAMSAVLFHFRSKITYMLHLYGIRKRSMGFSTARNGNYAYDAFICYSSKNRRFVLKRLAPFLETAPERYRLCLHERDFPLGSRIVENIVGSIEHSRKTIMVLSQHFVQSKWCKWELEMANHKMFNDDEHFLILIQLEELNRDKLPRHLKFFMDTRTFLEWPQEGEEEEEKKVRKRLKKALGESIFQRTSEEAPLLCDVMGDC